MTTLTAHVVGRADEVPVGEGRAFTAGGTPVAVFRLRDGSLRAVAAVCPHAGGPIADGQSDATVVVCPLHLNAWRWDGTPTTDAAPLPVYPVREEAGTLVVEV
ncbi:nitrite reductase (NADH) small subunit [Klenkia marina]|uniref:Nitrite reductase (NADH) small subunit n=1 Tax=Klenkia marina TaxID=1960309 RepID=A0A1G4YCT7_9ACTN|nr:Rieske (2Fe-2S) protein [Klenkia marina]SCX51139.1 nitrite reductase (NADH) small subunit [Klenkia marina]